MNTKILILINDKSRLSNTIKSKFQNVINLDHQSISNENDYNVCIDFTVLSNDEKIILFSKLKNDVKIYSDLTYNWTQLLLEKFSNLKGCFSADFFSPKNKCELFIKDQEDCNLNILIDIFSKIQIGYKNIVSIQNGFYYPRVISMIINEAYLSLEDNLATESDIDVAMKYGVNYPLGPFEWANEIGLSKIVLMLNLLNEISQNQRYQISSLLKKRSLLY